MKRFLGWLRRSPRLHVHFVEAKHDTNPLAQEAIESLQKTIKALESTLDLVSRLQTQLACARSELGAYALSCMDEDAQIAELERMRERKKD
jgi:hypothetical protein